jgi:hypothetical protein
MKKVVYYKIIRNSCNISKNDMIKRCMEEVVINYRHYPEMKTLKDISDFKKYLLRNLK